MRNAMKKLFSLMLVAVLLVGVLPFAASADGVPYYQVILSSDNTQIACEGLEEGKSYSIASFIDSGYVYDFGQHKHADGSINELGDPFQVVAGDVIVIAVKPAPADPCAGGHTPGAAATCTAAQTCTVCGATLEAAKGHTPGAAATCTTAQTCSVCQTVLANALGHNYVNGECDRPNCDAAEPTTTYTVSFDPNYNTAAAHTVSGIAAGASAYGIYTPTRVGYEFAGWYYDATLTERVSSSATINANETFYAKWTQIAPREVYVRVYANGNTNSVYAIVDLYGYAQDGVITKSDIEKAVAGYGIKASNDYGLKVYGPFSPADWNSYCLDDYSRGDGREKVEVKQNEKTVLYAMVHNVKTGSSSSTSGSKADSSNPKTGDMIFAPMMVLGASASCLAVLYYLNKKRAY